MAISDFFNAAVYGELAALAVSLFLVTRNRYGYYRLFTLFLVATLLTEWAGFYCREVLKTPNYPLYNGLMLVQALFFTFLFYRFMQSMQMRIFVITLFIFFLSYYLFETVKNDLAAYNKTSRLLLSGMVVAWCCTFYFSIIRQEQTSNPLYYPPFWIVTGLFFYYFGTVAMFAFYDRVSQIKFAGNLSFYNVVMGCLSCILYGCWIISFLCRIKQVP